MSLVFHEDSHAYELDGQMLPSVSQILRDMDFIDAQWFTEYACQRGTLVHRIIQYHLNGELDKDSVDPELYGYLEAWKKFEAETKYEAHIIELPMASEQHRFAGTPDSVGNIGKDRALVDIKTGAITPATQVQMAAYILLLEDTLEAPIIPHGAKIKRIAVQLKADGTYCLKEFKDRQDRQIFLAALACWQWQKNNKIR